MKTIGIRILNESIQITYCFSLQDLQSRILNEKKVVWERAEGHSCRPRRKFSVTSKNEVEEAYIAALGENEIGVLRFAQV